MGAAPTLVTDRLILRMFSDDDMSEFIRVVVSDDRVMATLPEVRLKNPDLQKAAAHEYITDCITPWTENGVGAWAVEFKETNELIGFCGFFKEKIDHGSLEIGYAIGRQFWGEGLVSEATSCVMEWLLAEYPKALIYGVTFAENTPSQQVLKKLGLVYEGDIDLYNSLKDGRGLMRFFANFEL